MVVDSVCPTSIMGFKEYEKLSRSYETKKSNSKGEKFKFGPSRIYDSEFKVKVPMNAGKVPIEADFFVVNGDVPILLGNDVMEPLGGNIDMKEKRLDLKNI